MTLELFYKGGPIIPSPVCWPHAGRWRLAANYPRTLATCFAFSKTTQVAG